MPICVPEWAKAGPSERLRFYLLTLAVHHNPSGSLSVLAKSCNVGKTTLLDSIKRGYCSRNVALALVEAVPGTGISELDLLQPK
ncbi:hypothetical protein AVP3_0004 [Aeromonas phage AVP3]|nr:hypothetical protein [Aeromonas phage BUCT552]